MPNESAARHSAVVFLQVPDSSAEFLQMRLSENSLQ